jgi:DNA-binding response OmpR family regulator
MSKNRNILIVEDEPAIAEMYRFKLEQIGYHVVNASDGGAGLKAAEELKPGLILLDLRMPVMNGDEMLEKLRATSWGSSIRVIILTNISRAEAPPVLRLLNVDRYIVKAHHTPSQVVKLVEEVLADNSSY